MNKEQMAKQMDVGEYSFVPSPENVSSAREHGLLIVYAASDDMMLFGGAIRDEFSVWDGGNAFIDRHGSLPTWGQVNDDESLAEVYFARKKHRKEIVAVWDEGDFPWSYKTDIPHATFDIFDDGENYCRGMVIDMCDV